MTTRCFCSAALLAVFCTFSTTAIAQCVPAYDDCMRDCQAGIGIACDDVCGAAETACRGTCAAARSACRVGCDTICFFAPNSDECRDCLAACESAYNDCVSGCSFGCVDCCDAACRLLFCNCGGAGQLPCGNGQCQTGLYPDPPLPPLWLCSLCAQGNPPYYCDWDGRGQEGQPPFIVGSIEYLRSYTFHLCDRGLTLSENTCVNGSRHSAYVNNFRNSWVYRALRLQRDINRNMPLTQGLILGSHNSYNTDADGYPAYQHTYSLSDQLDLGVRSVGLDVHWFPDADPATDLRLSHAQPDHLGFSPLDRPYRYAIEEIHAWLVNNPGEVILIDFENRGDGQADDIFPPLEHYMGQWLFRPSDLNAEPFYGAWHNVSPARLLERGLRVIVFNGGVRVSEAADVAHQDVIYVPGYANGRSFVSSFLNAANGYQYDPETQMSGMHPVDINQFTGDTQNVDNPFNEMMTPHAIRLMVKAGVDIISLDPIGNSLALGPIPPQFQDPTELMEAAVWSWAPTHPPTTGLAKAAKLVQFSPGVLRFQSASPSESRRIALRADPCSHVWTISATPMTFAQAQLQPGFAAPGNGLDMQRLVDTVIEEGLQISGVWVNYGTTAQAPNTWNAVVVPQAIPTFFVDRGNQGSPPYFGTPGHPFPSIAQALNAATECVSELRINGGVYLENLTINRNVTLMPYDGSGTVTIGD